MIRPSVLPEDQWRLVPRGVGGLILSMLADSIARQKGFDAITDHPLAFALNGLYEVSDKSSAIIDGTIASALLSVQVPKSINLLSVNEYSELRECYAGSRVAFSNLVTEIRTTARFERIASKKEFRARLDDVIENFEKEFSEFKKTKKANKVNEWTTLNLRYVLPVMITYIFGPVWGGITAGVGLGVQSLEKLLKKGDNFYHPRVLQALASTQNRTFTAELKQLRGQNRTVNSKSFGRRRHA
jgi:hypothetical protein